MSESLYSFSGHNKIAVPLLYRDNYDWRVEVFEDYLEIHRSGRLRAGLQTKTTIYFQDVTDVQYYTSFNFTWIIFAMPGIDQSSSVFTTSSVTKNTSVTTGLKPAEDIPYSNTYAICNYSDKAQTLRKHFEVIHTTYENYRRNQKAETAPAAAQLQDNTYEKLKQLKDLLEIGILTQDEYEQKRKMLIEKL